MMKPSEFTGAEHHVAAAAIQAVMEARWETTSLLARRPVESVPDLLRARAAELATSAWGRDQVMSVALEAAADDVENGRPALATGALFFFQGPADPEARLPIQREVFRRFGSAEQEADAIVAVVEEEHRRAASGASPGEISARLFADALLHKQLWDLPRLRADSHTRLTMLCSVPRLVERARALDPLRLRSLRTLINWPRRARAQQAP